jgi:phage gp46-like protein
MSDVAIFWDVASGRGDWGATAFDLATGAPIESAVMASLFSDRRASADYVDPDPNGIPDLRGWWGDSYEASLLGSRLWQLNRSKITDATTVLNKARDYCQEALQWLVDDGIAASVSVQTFWVQNNTVGIIVTISSPALVPPQRFQYAWAWNGL